MTSEAAITRAIQVATTTADCRMFRNNTGQAWQGEVTRLKSGDILIRNPRPVTFGLCEGSADLIGITRVVITPEDVGKAFGRFAALEVKRPGYRPTSLQQQFLTTVRCLGGIAAVVTSPDDAQHHVTQRPAGT